MYAGRTYKRLWQDSKNDCAIKNPKMLPIWDFGSPWLCFFQVAFTLRYWSSAMRWHNSRGRILPSQSVTSSNYPRHIEILCHFLKWRRIYCLFVPEFEFSHPKYKNSRLTIETFLSLFLGFLFRRRPHALSISISIVAPSWPWRRRRTMHD